MRLLLLSKYYVCFFVAIMIASWPGNMVAAQSQSLTEIKNSFTNYKQSHLEEKVFVHTDRSFYLCGEILWFKAYLTNAQNNNPLDLSKVVYVELLNNSYQPVLQAKVSIDKENGNGSFHLPFSLASGNYILRAYTNWMKNFPADNYFERTISIVNSLKNMDSSAVPPSMEYSADFFPEGGNLVNGLQSKLAFRITDKNNKGVNAEGVIVDQQKDTIARFKTTKFGMGNVSIKPASGKTYTAIVTLPNGTSVRKNLPEAYNSGYVMHVDDAGNGDLKISVNSSGAQHNSSIVYLVAVTNENVDFAKSQQLQNSETVFIINKNILKEGMAHLTLFDENKQPRCERLYFTRPKNRMLIDAKSGKSIYETRSLVEVNMAAVNADKKPLSGNLSASVFRLNNFNQPAQEDVFSYLWLTSNLNGPVENPSYFLANDNAETNEALNNLLMTQGWRKFNWQDALQNKKSFFTYVPELAGHIITGRIINENTKQPVEGVQVYLSVPGKRVQLRGCKSDSQGFVHFEMRDFFGAKQIVVQTNEENSKDLHLEIFSPFSEKYSRRSVPQLTISSKEKEELSAGSLHMEIQNSYHQDRLLKMQMPVVDTTAFFRKPYKTYLLGDYTRFTTMEEVMREYVAEVNVRRSGSQFRFNTFNNPGFQIKSMQAAEQVFFKNPLVLFDGVPVFDINKIIAYDPLKVERLDVVAERYHFGTITSEGILSYTTYKGQMEDFTLNPNDVVLDYESLQQKRVFYAPNYSTAETLSSRLPDFRELLLWAPDLTTGLDGTGKFSFYTSDVPGQYAVIVQGLSADGSAGSYSFTFTVRK